MKYSLGQGKTIYFNENGKWIWNWTNLILKVWVKKLSKLIIHLCTNKIKILSVGKIWKNFKLIINKYIKIISKNKIIYKNKQLKKINIIKINSVKIFLLLEIVKISETYFVGYIRKCIRAY